MVNYGKIVAQPTPQSEPLPGSGQVENNAGGFAWAIDKWSRLRRFLVLGCDGGTHYQSERKLTLENAQCIRECLAEDGPKTVETIRVMWDGRAPKPDPILFAFALAFVEGNPATKAACRTAFNAIVRTGYHLFRFFEFASQLGGKGRKAIHKAVRDWYLGKNASQLAYQMAKYQSRGGWSHKDLIYLSKPKAKGTEPEDLLKDKLFTIAIRSEKRFIDWPKLADPFPAMEELKSITSAEKAARFIVENPGLTHEMIPGELLAHREVWESLLQRMPVMATLRNLGQLTARGVLGTAKWEQNKVVVDRLTNEEQVSKSRIHPLDALVASKIYEAGHGERGKLEWTPEPAIVAALEKTFMMAFKNVEPMGKRICIGVDVSSSMTSGNVGGVPGLTPNIAAAALSMIWVRTEPLVNLGGFCHEFRDLKIGKADSLNAAMKKTQDRSFGATDCALPVLEAMKKAQDFDLFIVLTDSETWCGQIHASQALKTYRRHRVVDAKLAVVGMTASEFSIADPKDIGMADFVGFDAALPRLIKEFSTGYGG